MNIAAYLPHLINLGYTATQILNYASKKFKGLNNQINNARSNGYMDEDILKYLSGPSQKSKSSNLSPEEKALKSGGLLTKEEHKEKNQKYLGAALQAGGAALAAYGAYSSATAGPRFTASGAQLPSSITRGPPAPKQLPSPPLLLSGPGGGAQAPAPPPGPLPVSPMQGMTPGMAVEQQIKSPQAPLITPPPQQPMQAPEMTGQAEMVQAPAKQTYAERAFKGIDLNQIPAEMKKKADHLVKSLMNAEQRGLPWEAPLVQGLVSKVDEFLTGKKQGLVEQEKMRVEEAYKKPEIGQNIITPDLEEAKIISESPSKMLVEVDGKKKSIDKDSGIKIPDNADDIAHHYQRVLDLTPEEDKSRLADYIGFDPSENTLLITFHDGTTYEYPDVNKEIVDAIVNSEFMAKTSGGNYIGNWYKGAPSKGAGLSLLIKDLQSMRGGKGKEYKGKFKELYSLHRFAKEAKKAEHEAKRKKKT